MENARRDPDPYKLVEKLSAKEYRFIEQVVHSPPLTQDWSQAWLHIVKERLRLSATHLRVAISIHGRIGSRPDDETCRSVISRAYYSMYCAARAAVALETRGDINDHQRLSDVVKTIDTWSVEDRCAVGAALSRFRTLRNDADYSPFYPSALELDADESIITGVEVLRICRRWVKETKGKRGLT